MNKRRGRGEGTLIECTRRRADGSKRTFWHGQASLGFDGRGKRIRKDFYGASKTAVLAAMEKWRVEHRELSANFADDQRLAVGQFLQKWLDDAVRPSKRPKTFTLYKGIVRKLESALGRIRLKALTPLQIQRALSTIGDSVRKGNGNGRTTQLAFSTLRCALNQAIKWRMLTANPCNGVERPKAKQREMRVWDEGQVQQFLARTKKERFFALYATALATGMRRGELLGLQIDDIDLNRGIIGVQRQLVEINGHMELGEVKTSAGKRRIDLPADTVRLLKNLKANAISSFAFGDKAGKPLIGARVSRMFKEVVKKAEVPEISFHEMRHTHATLLLLAGVSPKVVQERLGHSNVSITLQTYSHVLPSLQADAAAALNSILNMNGQAQSARAKRSNRISTNLVFDRGSPEIGSTLAVQGNSHVARSLMNKGGP